MAFHMAPEESTALPGVPKYEHYRDVLLRLQACWVKLWLPLLLDLVILPCLQNEQSSIFLGILHAGTLCVLSVSSLLGFQPIAVSTVEGCFWNKG